MLVVVFIRVLTDLAGLLVLRPAQAKSLNMRGAYLEVLGDLIGSLAVVAAVLILIAGWTPFDAGTSTSRTALSSSSRLATKNPRPPTTRDLAARWARARRTAGSASPWVEHCAPKSILGC